mmetsp:Transcript_29301/g.80278  ORF Transcript_29301/g.80278 Transcript_29301/m.80278 type:complete len:206 (+) Transcript_29301:397-1014(+)
MVTSRCGASELGVSCPMPAPVLPCGHIGSLRAAASSASPFSCSALAVLTASLASALAFLAAASSPDSFAAFAVVCTSIVNICWYQRAARSALSWYVDGASPMTDQTRERPAASHVISSEPSAHHLMSTTALEGASVTMRASFLTSVGSECSFCGCGGAAAAASSGAVLLDSPRRRLLRERPSAAFSAAWAAASASTATGGTASWL